MGVLPLQFPADMTRKTLKLDGSERFDIINIANGVTPQMKVAIIIHREEGSSETIETRCRIDTIDEVDYYRHGGILHFVLRRLIGSGSS